MYAKLQSHVQKILHNEDSLAKISVEGSKFINYYTIVNRY